MHELAVTESLLEIALRHANNAGAKRILKINIIIGQLASVIDDSVQFYWGLIAKDTIAEDAKLDFSRRAALLLCSDCGQRFGLNNGNFTCPNCKSINVKVIEGNEFYMSSIDIE